MVTQEEHDVAVEQGRAIKESGLYAVAATFDPATELIHITLKKGFTVSFPKERSQVLAPATNEQLSQIEVDEQGWIVFFPKLEDGFTVEGMLAGRFGNARWEREWEAKHRSAAA